MVTLRPVASDNVAYALGSSLDTRTASAGSRGPSARAAA